MEMQARDAAECVPGAPEKENKVWSDHWLYVKISFLILIFLLEI